MAAILVGLIIGVAFVLTRPQEKSVEPDSSASLYYINPNTNLLEFEKRTLSATSDSDKVIEILQYLFETGPSNPNLKGLTDGKQIYKNLEIVQGTVKLYLNDEYKKLSSTDKIFARSSITWSLTSLDSVKNVVFYEDDKIIPLGAEDDTQYARNNVLLNPAIDPKDTVAVDFKLYFANSDYTKLAGEIQTVNINPNDIKETYIVKQLIKGPDVPTSKALIPPSTKVLKVETDNRTCYVNLSKDFVSKQSDPFKLNLAVYSIVNSLTELSNVDSVQILIDSKRVDDFGKTVNLTRDDSLIVPDASPVPSNEANLMPTASDPVSVPSQEPGVEPSATVPPNNIQDSGVIN